MTDYGSQQHNHSSMLTGVQEHSFSCSQSTSPKLPRIFAYIFKARHPDFLPFFFQSSLNVLAILLKRTIIASKGNGHRWRNDSINSISQITFFYAVMLFTWDGITGLKTYVLS